MPHIKLLAGNGHQIKFWTDPWVNGGRLKDCHGDRAVYDLGVGPDINVPQFIQNHRWKFPTPTSNALMDIFQTIPNEIEPWPNFNDGLVWTLQEHGNFTLKSPHNLVCRKWDQTLQRPSMIWFTGCIKKHSICAWMLLRGRLKKKDFLLQRNVACDSCCVLCNLYMWDSCSFNFLLPLLSRSVEISLRKARPGADQLWKSSIGIAGIHYISNRAATDRPSDSWEHSSTAVLQNIIQTACIRTHYLDIAFFPKWNLSSLECSSKQLRSPIEASSLIEPWVASIYLVN